jgi:hypothetical protein
VKSPSDETQSARLSVLTRKAPVGRTVSRDAEEREVAKRGSEVGGHGNQYVVMSNDPTSPPTLRDLGVSRDEASQRQKLADIPKINLKTIEDL